MKHKIHIAIGTKAQFIKMAPIMHQFDRRKVQYNLIDLGQHSLITEQLRKEFSVKVPDVILSRGKNTSTLLEGFYWLVNQMGNALNINFLRNEVFKGSGGFCLIHGDTISTIIGLILAKRIRINVVHIEAGLRSYNWLQPFPEELIRIATMKYADLLFAPSLSAFNNLKKMGLDYKSILLPANTSIESTYYSLAKPLNVSNIICNKPYVLITAHRMENIFSFQRMELLIRTIEHISQKMQVVFVQHHPTIIQLKKFGLNDRLKKLNDIKFLKILSHSHFIHLLDKCSFVISDGGSIQEESYYLNKPCLLFRSITERQEGLNENVVLCNFNWAQIEYFIENWNRYKRITKLDRSLTPSEVIVNHILNS